MKLRGHNRKPEFIAKWRSIRHKCVLCGAPVKAPHHKQPVSDPHWEESGESPDTWDNVIDLCEKRGGLCLQCHGTFHSYMGTPWERSVRKNPGAHAKNYVRWLNWAERAHGAKARGYAVQCVPDYITSAWLNHYMMPKEEESDG